MGAQGTAVSASDVLTPQRGWLTYAGLFTEPQWSGEQVSAEIVQLVEQASPYLGRAVPLFEATLAQREQVLGDTHPHTLVSRNNLAGAYRSAGDLGRAIPLFEATLAQYEQVLGDTHPDTLASRNNLARVRELVQTRQQLNTATPATDTGQQPSSGTSE